MNKIYTAVIKSRIANTLDHCLQKAQFGFRRKKSCLQNLVLYIDSLDKWHANNLPCDTIMVDYEKAFDKVDFGLLIDKLWEANIRGALLRTIIDWLKRRERFVDIQGTYSKRMPIKSSVIQGSVLGPLMFLVVINGLVEKVQKAVKEKAAELGLTEKDYE